MLFGLVLPHDVAHTQTRRDVAILIEQVKAGAEAEVAKLLPALKKSHPDKAGVVFLEALMESNAEKSVDLYQRVADEFPRSEWADDALYRLYQYSYAVGAYRTARTYTERIAKEHPKSPFLRRDQRTTVKNVPAQKAAGGSKAVKEKTEKKPAVEKKPPKAGDSGAGSYAVQVGAYSKVVDASKQVDELKTKGYTAYLREKKVNGKTVQAVWLGIFPDFTQAQAFARKLKEQQRIDAIVVRR